MSLAEVLPPVNAALNTTSAVLLLLGFAAIRRGRRERHRALMLAALGASALFLAGYLTRLALTGTTRFPGEGALRGFYLTVLGTHTVLAAAAAPMILRTLYLALRGRFADHRRIARWTLPAWVYVSVTGVVVYVMLYHPTLTRSEAPREERSSQEASRAR
jgi:putative membrane protein